MSGKQEIALLHIDINAKLLEELTQCLEAALEQAGVDFYYKGKKIDSEQTSVNLLLQNDAQILGVPNSSAGGKTKYWMRGKNWSDGWGVESYSNEAMIFVPKRWVKIMVFLWDKDCRNRSVKLKYKFRIDDGEDSEFYECDKKMADEQINVPQLDEKFKFYEFMF